MKHIARLAVFLLMTCAHSQPACEWEARVRYKRFTATVQRYVDLRNAGVISLKERERMRADFDELMKCECF